MEPSTLRWTLVILGLVILGLIFLFGNPEKRKPRASRHARKSRTSKAAGQIAERKEPVIGDPGADLEDAAGAAAQQGELQIDDEPEAAPPRRDAGPAPDRIVSLYLLARDNHVITGAQLLEATVKTGMEFGEMNIFHRKVEGDSRPVFSMANAAKPGSFDRDSWNEFETVALVLFTTLPNPLSALDAWDSMLTTAQRIAALLGAELQDEQHHPFSRQREAQMREEMRDYDREHGTTRA